MGSNPGRITQLGAPISATKRKVLVKGEDLILQGIT